jgi:hypothetical protein
MSVCFYQRDPKLFSKRIESKRIESKRIEDKIFGDKYKIVDIKMVSFYINHNKLTDIINVILSQFCNAAVIGFDKRMNKYWCKMYDDKCCTLHIEVEIFNKDDIISLVKFITLIGTDILIDNFVSNFTESIELYTSS